MNRQRFSAIAHANHRFASPVSPDRAAALLGRAGVGAGAKVLDLGCGFGGWALLAHELGADVNAVDPNADFIDRGRAANRKVTWVQSAYEHSSYEAKSFDCVLCIGSTHALGGLIPALVECRRLLADGGSVVIGEGFWAKEPELGYLELLGSTRDEMGTHEDNARAIRNAGWKIQLEAVASAEEWAEYEGLYRHAMLDWLADNPADSDAPVFREHSDKWYAGYQQWGKDTLGFGFYVASPSASEQK